MKDLKKNSELRITKTNRLLPSAKDISIDQIAAERIAVLERYGIKAAADAIEEKHDALILKQVEEEFSGNYNAISEKDLFDYIKKYGLYLIKPHEYKAALTKKMEQDIYEFLTAEEYKEHLDHYILVTRSGQIAALIEKVTVKADQNNREAKQKYIIIGNYSSLYSGVIKRFIAWLTFYKEPIIYAVPLITTFLIAQISAFIFGYTPIAVSIFILIFLTAGMFFLFAEQLETESDLKDTSNFGDLSFKLTTIGCLKKSAETIGKYRNYDWSQLFPRLQIRSIFVHIITVIAFVWLSIILIPTSTIHPFEDSRIISSQSEEENATLYLERSKYNWLLSKYTKY